MAFRWPGSRRGALPHDVAEALGIEAGERVLAWSRLTGGGHAAAGVVALRVLTERGRLIHRPWLDVDHVAWAQDSHMLAVWWVGSRSATPLELPDASYLPEVIHERVRASVVISQDVSVEADGRTLKGRVALRKNADGALVVQTSSAARAEVDHPLLVAAMAEVAARLRQDAGLPQ